MLFSNNDVANLVNRNFEASWEMVRPVPIIRIDFGNGAVATRTLHGNIATHVCTADGQIVDVLPGIYTPPAYRGALEQVRRVAVSLAANEQDRQEQLRRYHQDRANTLRTRPERIVYAAPPNAAASVAARVAQGANAAAAPRDVGKGRLEFPLEQIVIVPRPANNGQANPAIRPPALRNLAQWDLLAADTWHNETTRRLQIHDRLAEADPFRPEQLKRWLYREVLHADLDDPYLGLGDVMFGDDVFRDER